jgi:hypothetical protein
MPKENKNPDRTDTGDVAFRTDVHVELPSGRVRRRIRSFAC